jgi:hypothetical protein
MLSYRDSGSGGNEVPLEREEMVWGYLCGMWINPYNGKNNGTSNTTVLTTAANVSLTLKILRNYAGCLYVNFI